MCSRNSSNNDCKIRKRSSKANLNNINKYINRLNANPFYLFTGTGPFFLDEQHKVNKENLIKIKKKELNDLENEAANKDFKEV